MKFIITWKNSLWLCKVVMKCNRNAHAEHPGKYSSALNSVNKVKVIETFSEKFGDVIARPPSKN